MNERFLTEAELYARKGGADNVQRPLEALDEPDRSDAVAQALRWAEDRFVSYATKYRGQLPTAPAETPEAVKSLVADLARWRLETEHTDLPAPAVVEGGKRALQDLVDLAAGRRQLSLEARADDVTPRVHVGADTEAEGIFDHAGARRGLRI